MKTKRENICKCSRIRILVRVKEAEKVVADILINQLETGYLFVSTIFIVLSVLIIALDINLEGNYLMSSFYIGGR